LIASFIISAIGSAKRLKFTLEDFLPKVNYREMNTMLPIVKFVLNTNNRLSISYLKAPSMSNIL